MQGTYLLLTSIILLIMDSFYMYACGDYFNSVVKAVQGADISPHMAAAMLCYAILILGLNYFAYKNVPAAFLLGIMVYGVYELTNLSILDKWSVPMAAIDTVWGGILMASTTAIATALV